MEQEKKTCAECRYFVQHYARLKNQKYIPTDYGHCGNPRIREKKPETPACQRFSRR